MRTALLTFLLAAAVGCSNSAPTTARGSSDREALRGVWAVEAAEAGPDVAPEESKRANGWRLHIHEDRLSLGTGDDWQHYTFVVDSSREPKGLTLYEVPAGKQRKGGIPKPPRTKGSIYKFEGDKFVLAFIAKSDAESIPPPADFKAEKDVIVLRLTKTDEQPRTDWGAKPANPKK